MRNQLEEQFLQIVFVMAFADFFERAFGEDPAAMQNGDLVAKFLGLAHDVRGKNDALALIAQFGHGFQQRAGDQHVEAGRGFIENQHRRIVDHRPGDRHLLLHARGHLRSEDFAGVVQLESLEELFHPLVEFVFRNAVQTAEVFDHLPTGHAVIDGGAGRHESDPAPHLGRLSEHVEAVDCRRAGCGFEDRA